MISIKDDQSFLFSVSPGRVFSVQGKAGLTRGMFTVQSDVCNRTDKRGRVNQSYKLSFIRVSYSESFQ